MLPPTNQVHNEDVGYCQGLNNVAALMLLCADREEDCAFWLLVSLVEGRLYPDTFSSTLAGEGHLQKADQR